MLKKLIVKNFAIIEDIEVEFKAGMTSITGETGAGKSLIIDSIGLLLGSRASKDMIRYGSTDALIVGEFIKTNRKVIESLLEYNIPNLEILTITRKISTSSNGKVLVNGVSINLNILREITSNLADIHVQHDTYRLINRDSYLSFIDDYTNTSFLELYNDYQLKLNNYLDKYTEYKNIINKQKNTSIRLEFLEYEKNELLELDLKEDEDLLLETEINKLSNYDKLYNSLSEIYNNFTQDDYDLLDYLYKSSKSLEMLSKIDKKYLKLSSSLYTAYCDSLEVKETVKDDLESLNFDPLYLDSLLERVNNINKIKTKYKKSVSELIKYLKDISLEISLVNDYDNVLNEHKKNLEDSHKALVVSSTKLSGYRKSLSKIIEKSLVEILGDLDLHEAKFIVSFNSLDLNNVMNREAFLDSGVDKIDFLVSLNKGEPLKPLSKTSSGGEMSRIMLAFKTYFSNRSPLDLMIFDEIDSGISGSTAVEVARKMKEISKHMQVLCITHLPQVASFGDMHYYIYKEVINNRTFTRITALDREGKINALAKMLSGKKVTKFAYSHAKELLENSI